MNKLTAQEALVLMNEWRTASEWLARRDKMLQEIAANDLSSLPGAIADSVLHDPNAVALRTIARLDAERDATRTRLSVMANERDTLVRERDEALALLRAWSEQHTKLSGFETAYGPYIGCAIPTRALLNRKAGA